MQESAHLNVLPKGGQLDIFKKYKVFFEEHIERMRSNFFQDILAGVTVAVIALPLAIAFGVASGLGPQAGLWAAVCGGLFVGVFGGSHYGVSGPTGPKVVQLAALIELTRLASGEPDLSFIFATVLLSGVICILLSFCKIGHFIYYVPYSAVSGFMCGIGIIIILLELPPVLGYPTPSSVYSAIKELPYAVTHENTSALLIALLTFGITVFWPKINKNSKVPGPLLALLAGSGFAYFMNLKIPFVSEFQVSSLKLYIPSLSMFSDRFGEMLAPAMALAGLCIFDSLLTCLVADNMTHEKHSSNREIFGQGVANIACGIVGGVTTATATMRTVANIKFGARSSLSAIVHGLVILLFMYALAPLIAFIPMACLAGILLKVGFDIIDYRILPVLHRVPRADAVCFWAVLITTISVDLLVAMAVGLVIAFVRAIHDIGNIYRPKIGSLEEFISDNNEAPHQATRGVYKMRLRGPLFFGATSTLQECLSSLKKSEFLILNLKEVPYIDLSGGYMLDDIMNKARLEGTKIFLCNVPSKVQKTLTSLKVMAKAENQELMSVDEALSQIKEHKDNIKVEGGELCAT